MRTRSKFVVAFCAAFVLRAGAEGADYFVDKQGNDANDGASRAAAFLTIQKGVDALKPGDTLAIIARRVGTSADALAQANHLVNPNLIYVGQRLVISTGSPAPPAPGQIHIVQRGETLYSIARRYNTTYWTIAIANHLSNPNVIYAGQRLVIP